MSCRHTSLPTAQIKPNPRNARVHPKKQVGQIAASIRAFGFAAPVLVDEYNVLIAGHARWAAAKLIGLELIPAIVVEGLSDAQKRALMLADNRIPQSAGWDRERLTTELAVLPELLIAEDLDIELAGFAPAEINALHADFGNTDPDRAEETHDDCWNGPAVTQSGDLWQLGKHRLLCGDARNPSDLTRLLGGEQAHMGFLDPPACAAVRGVAMAGGIKHREFAMASDGRSRDAIITFLKVTLHAAAMASVEGAVHFVGTNWLHIEELIATGRSVYGAMLDLIAWDKSYAQQGGFYQSGPGLIGVFRVGATVLPNKSALRRHGRNRSNVWRFTESNSFGVGGMDHLRADPIPKPVAMIADAMKDCTRRNEIVLDIFGGSGGAILAAERVGRRGCGLESDPRLVDVAVRRWQLATATDAVHAASGLTFEEASRRACQITPQRRTRR